LKVWMQAEEKFRVQAQQYYDAGDASDGFDKPLPEEYRNEYIEKQKRKMKIAQKEKDKNVTEVTIITKD